MFTIFVAHLCGLLVQPTNHLDAESVAWLERTLKEFRGTVCAVTHDRCAALVHTTDED
jgi:hypothetical protein